MRLITIEEQKAILKVLAHQYSAIGMMKCDSICYGGPVEAYSETERYVHRVIDAFPEDVRQAYDQELKKAKADKLRAQADELEKS